MKLSALQKCVGPQLEVFKQHPYDQMLEMLYRALLCGREVEPNYV